MSTDLPPEAYTRDTLQAAFDWLQSQPEVVRNSVHTPDRLVSLFRKSQRLNDNDHPVSSKKFMADLKNLASSLNEFEGQNHNFQMNPPQGHPLTTATPVNTPMTHLSAQAPSAPSQPLVAPTIATFQPPLSEAPPQPSIMDTPPSASIGTHHRTTETIKKASFEMTTKTQETVSTQLEMDDLTIQRVESVQKRFNLSSKKEALRLLVSIGYEKFSNFP